MRRAERTSPATARDYLPEYRSMIVLDARQWEPPRPFEEVMDALCRLQPGERIRLIVGREPLPLYTVLERNGYAWFAMARDDGAFEVDICERVVVGDD